MSSERGGQSIHPEPAPDAGPSRSDTWIGRVKEADAHAEKAFLVAMESGGGLGVDITAEELTAIALCSIAAELRAQRIARRPGAGQ